MIATAPWVRFWPRWTSSKTVKYVERAITTEKAKQIAYVKCIADVNGAKLKGFVAMKRQVPLVVYECVHDMLGKCLATSTNVALFACVRQSVITCWQRVVDELNADDPELVVYSRGESTVLDVVPAGQSPMVSTGITRVKHANFDARVSTISHRRCPARGNSGGSAPNARRRI